MDTSGRNGRTTRQYDVEDDLDNDQGTRNHGD